MFPAIPQTLTNQLLHKVNQNINISKHFTSRFLDIREFKGKSKESTPSKTRRSTVFTHETGGRGKFNGYMGVLGKNGPSQEPLANV
jgi:hypothetical protein